jgi:hypothetical protein
MFTKIIAVKHLYRSDAVEFRYLKKNFPMLYWIADHLGDLAVYIYKLFSK